MTKQLLNNNTWGNLRVAELGAARKARLADSEARNPTLTFGSPQQKVALFEAALLLLVFGSNNYETVKVEHASLFLINEELPDEWVRASNPVTIANVISTALKVGDAARFSGMRFKDLIRSFISLH
ncbi:hypothetical protein CCR75_002461 [Bremia lactucae]|uniref:Heme haloperoxidase family profile domain-containing protein n=1 Tax=Bremia lactucae TaxID=4779 RepID=A0A976FCV5_BRELC|nr:hypothetical protein CCR75_002461 [Bremia lactucae]